jgi:hypothetical protein
VTAGWGVEPETHPGEIRRRPIPSPPMFKFLFALTIGIALGYNYGWKDAQVNEKAVYERVVDQIGGSNRELVRNDIDGRLAAESR